MQQKIDQENGSLGEFCLTCNDIERCSSLLSQNCSRPAGSTESDDPQLLRHILENYQQSFLKYKNLFEAAPDAIFVADTETGLILEANTKAAEMLGIAADQIIGMHQSQLHPPQETERYKKIFQDHIEKGSAIFSDDIYVQHKDGHQIPVQINATATQIGSRGIIYGIFRDITEQSELQHQLKDSEERYRQLYKNAPAALYRTRISDGMLLDCSRATARLIGYDNEENFKSNFCVTDTYVDPSQREEFIRTLKKEKQVDNFEIQIRRKDGTPIWIADSAEIFPEQDCIEGVMVDITIMKTLTKTELNVLRKLMDGKSNKEIARSMKRSVRTIEDHRAHIMHKLEVDNLVDLTRKVLKQRYSFDNL